MMETVKLNLGKYIPFLLRTVKYKPVSIVMSLTYRCNSRCIMCNYWKYKVEQKMELTKDEVINILAEAKKLGIHYCTFYGGEPLLKEDILEIVSYAHSKGFVTRIITNGLLLGSDKAERIIQSGLDSITVSIDTCGEDLDKIRGIKDVYKRVYSNLVEVIGLKKWSNIKINIASLLMLPTLKNNNILKIIEVAEKLEVSVIIQLLDFSLFYYQDVNKKVKDELWISEKHQEELNILVDKLVEIKKKKPWLIINSIPALKYIKRYFKDPKSKDIPCYIAFSGRIWIDPHGKVFSCQGLPAVGDLRKEKLENIINSERWRIRIENMFKKICSGCTCMYSSNVDAHIPLAWRNILIRKFLRK